jgi:hypothetical protein
MMMAVAVLGGMLTLNTVPAILSTGRWQTQHPPSEAGNPPEGKGRGPQIKPRVPQLQTARR